MTEKTKKSMKVMTPEFRAAFCDVFRPTAFEKQEPKFGITMLFPKGTDLSEMKAAAREAISNKWKTKPPGLKTPFRDGAEKSDLDGFEDCIFVRAISSRQPGIVDRDLTEIISEKDFYAGCYARATVNAFTWEFAGKKGVSFGLMNIQKLRDGESFLGISNPKDDFGEVDGGEKNDPTDDDLDL